MEEKKHIFKLMWWSDYQDLKDKIFELRTDLKESLYKTRYVEEENLKLKNAIKELEKQNDTKNLEIELAKLKNKLDSKEEVIRKLKKEKFDQITDFQKKIREANGRSGGLQCHINKLLKEIEELKIEKKEDGYKHIRVSGSTMPRKKQPVKETIRP